MKKNNVSREMKLLRGIRPVEIHRARMEKSHRNREEWGGASVGKGPQGIGHKSGIEGSGRSRGN